ncbi:MAG: glycosyltransferase [Acinetobacter johnsonii]
MQENLNDSLSKQAETQTDQNIVLCMKWGTKYGAEYVNRLYNMVKRHTTVDFKMVCLTDRTEGIDPAVQCFPIPPLALPEGSPERGWNKLSTFEPDLYGLQGNALFLDLDVVIVDNIDSFFTHPGDFLIIHDWKRPWRITGNSSVYRFKLGAFPGLMPYFREHFDEIRQKFRNEQAYLSWYVDQEKKLSYWPDSWCKSYKYHCLQKIPLAYFKPPVKPEGVKVIIFHGEINPPDAINGGGGKWYRYVLPSQWIKDAWQ